MERNNLIRKAVSLVAAILLLVVWAQGAQAMIDGETGLVFNLTAKADRIKTPDGSSLLLWGFALDGGRAQYPGPTLILDQSQQVEINLTNEFDFPVSMVFPGQVVTATGGVAGPLTREAVAGNPVTYRFTANNPGTFLYHSGTRPELQVEMGLVGAIIVRPMGFDHMAPQAYNHPDSRYDREVLFLLTEMDPRIHQTVEFQGVDALDGTDFLTSYFPNYWFINGRCAPDTMLMPGVCWLPTQPYDCMPRMHPGEKLLMRVIGGGRDVHPFHHHGNHARVIARDARLLSSAPAAGADLSNEVFTVLTSPGQTYDAIFEWTGKGLGWDIYGTGPGYTHDCVDANNDGYDDTTWEWCEDHGRPLTVQLPEGQNLTFGGFWSGSPYMGSAEALPPGEGGLNPNGGFVFMWHSHSEKEMTNWDIFPGGMMTMLIVEPPGVQIPH